MSAAPNNPARYRPSGSLRSLQPPRARSSASATSLTPDLSVESTSNEERYWSFKYGLGRSRIVPSSGKRGVTGFSKVDASVPSGAVAEHATFSPRGYEGGETNHQLAISGGPRVCLYGPGPRSSLARALNRDGPGLGPDGSSGEPDLFGGKVAVSASDGGGGVKADRTVTTHGRLAHCSAYRPDGRLLAVGTDGGFVRVYDARSRATLRTFGGGRAGRGDGHPVRSVTWTGDGKRVISGGDDAVVNVWDLGGESGAKGGSAGAVRDGAGPSIVLRGHGDVVRSVAVVRVRPDADEVEGGKGGESRPRTLVLSASYDHTIRAWDLDDNDEGSDRCVTCMDHGSPVETLAVFPARADRSVPIVASAGGTSVKLWDVLTGWCLCEVKTRHSKTITSLCLATVYRDDGGPELRSNLRLLTAGLDGLIRIHGADDLDGGTDNGASPLSLPYLHGVSTPHPITALAMSPDSSRLVIGTTAGIVTVRQRSRAPRQGRPTKRKVPPRAGTYSYFTRGADAEADADDHVVILQRKRRLKEYDLLLRQFCYGDALDEALGTRQPDTVMAVLEELGRRRGLSQALSNRDEETLEPLLAFVARYVARPKYASILIGVAGMLCDVYGPVVGQSEVIDEYFDKLRRQVREESRVQKTLLQLVGQIDAVMFAAEIQQDAPDEEEG